LFLTTAGNGIEELSLQTALQESTSTRASRLAETRFHCFSKLDFLITLSGKILLREYSRVSRCCISHIEQLLVKSPTVFVE